MLKKAGIVATASGLAVVAAAPPAAAVHDVTHTVGITFCVPSKTLRGHNWEFSNGSRGASSTVTGSSGDCSGNNSYLAVKLRYKSSSGQTIRYAYDVETNLPSVSMQSPNGPIISSCHRYSLVGNSIMREFELWPDGRVATGCSW